MSLQITRNNAIVINRGGKAHVTGWVRLANGIAPGTTWERKDASGRMVHATAQTGAIIPLPAETPWLLSADQFMELTGWKPPRGRPSEGKGARMELRLTPEQKAKAMARGGSPWVAELIDAAT